MTSVTLAIPTLGLEGGPRALSLERLIRESGLEFERGLKLEERREIFAPLDHPAVREARLFPDRLANWALGQAVFGWLAGSTSDYVGVVQDDVRFHPEGWTAILAGIEAKPDAEILNYHSSSPATRQLFVEGGIAWASSPDCAVGTFWLMQNATMRDFVRWCLEDLEPRALERLHEDDLIGVFAMATGRPIHHPVVSPVDHDVSIASAYGNDQHSLRRPAVTLWEANRDPHRRDWTKPETYNTVVAPVGRFYAGLYEWLPVLMRDKKLALDRRAAAAKDETPKRYAPWARSK